MKRKVKLGKIERESKAAEICSWTTEYASAELGETPNPA